MLELDEKNKEIDINLLPVVCMDEYSIINDSQQVEKELLINNYIDQCASSEDFLPDIESDTLFSEFTEPFKENKKQEKKEEKKIEIISIEKIECGPNLGDCKKIPINTIINMQDKDKNLKQVSSRRRSYYRSDEEILRDLTDENFV